MVFEKSCDNIFRRMFLNRAFAIIAKNQKKIIVAKICGPHVETWYCSTMIHEKIIDHGG